MSGKARAGVGKWTIVGVAMIAAVFTVAGNAPAQAQAAPIVYKSAGSASKVIRLENNVDAMTLNVAPHSRIPTFESSPIAAEPVVKANFGPVLVTPTARVEQPRGLQTAPAFAEPYAGPPYQVAGKWYVPAYEPNYDEVGIASWYGPTFHGKDAASGEVFDEMAMTAAHPTLPIPSLVRVTNLENGKTVVVRLNDRGPFVDDRIIDLSKAAGAALDMHKNGTAKVRVQYVGPAPAEANKAPVAAPQKADVVMKPLAPIAAKSATPAPVAKPVQTQTGFFLQAGSFADLANANALRDQLRTSAPVSVVAVTVNGSDYYRVMIGPWATRDQAEEAQNRFNNAGTKTLVVAKLN
ncbi:MAG: septal ring lytic transglycosylase RlpA family protein [Hyphomonadaceae bacterium]